MEITYRDRINYIWVEWKGNSKGYKGFPGGLDGKESACNVGDLGLIPWLGRSPGGEHGDPLQYSCLENPHGQRSLEAIVHGVTESQTRWSASAQGV